MAPTPAPPAHQAGPELRPPASVGASRRSTQAPTELQRRLGNRGASVAVRRRAAGADPGGVGSATSADAVEPEQAERLVEGAGEGLDAATRAAAVEVMTDPVVKRAPGGDAGGPEPVATPDATGVVLGEDTRAELAPGQPASGTGASATEAPGKGAPGKGAPGKGAPGEEASSKAAVGEEAPAEEASGETASAEDTSGKDASDAGEQDVGSAEQPEQAAEGGGAGGRGQGPSADTGPDSETDTTERAPKVPDTDAGALGTGDLVLIDVELAEHQRWSGAQARVGTAGSVDRAAFVAEAVGGGFTSGVASGAKMGLAMGLATRLVPAIGPMLGGGMALHGLMTGGWEQAEAAVAKFGEGSDTYETLANSIAAVSAVVNTVSQLLTVINGIVGVVQTAAAVIAGGAVIAAFFTFGATLGIAAVAGDVVAVCEEISVAINTVTAILDGINNIILQPCITLFQALHTFTAQADPRDVETQGKSLSSAAEASGSALGGWIGGKAAHVKGKGKPPGEDVPPSQKKAPELPPPASGDGPTVRFEEPATPVAHGAEGPITTPLAEPVAPSVAHAAESGTPAAPTQAAAPAATAPEQLSFPGMEAPSKRPPRKLTPDEVAPPDAHSAYLRRLRAEAEGGPAPKPRRRLQNIARYLIPDWRQRGSWESHSPTPDLYQYSPRGKNRHAHHLEMQEAFKTKAGEWDVVPGYHPNEDPTVLMRRTDHEKTYGAQGQQRAGGQPDPQSPYERISETIGRSDALEEARNIAAWGTRDAPPPGVKRRQLMDPDVAGQAVMEHAAYLFETSRISRRGDPVVGEPPPPSPRAGETPLTDRPVVGEVLASRGETIDPFENVDWDRTFDQPDPYRAAQPPGTQLALPGMEHLAPRPGPDHEQLSLPGIDEPGPDPRQLALPFERRPESGPSTPPPQQAPPPSPPPVTTPAASPTPTATPTTAQTPSTGYSAEELGIAPIRPRVRPDNQPSEGVERVNPQYPPPPATPAQITAIQNEIMNLLAVRAAAEQEAQREGERVDRSVENQGPIAQTVADTTAGISAVQVHDEAVARRAAVNAEQQKRQQESQTLAAQYADRTTGFAVLSVPLRAWEGFTSLASHLPGRAGAAMQQMNTEAQQMQAAFGEMGAKMLGVDSAGPTNAQGLQDDQARLQATDVQAQRSDKRLQTASAGAKGIQQANEEALAEATDRRNTATDRAQECSDAAETREKQADTLAERLRAWAGRHAEARRQATRATTERLRHEGRKILGSTER